ncbi:cobyrinate a,c-diamide synthase [Paenibacillus oenotherae]|uniref:Cobyrinate a,c-diamide synthase n=1 Tax=Paenibacillus oenotherae TaxID=1435645 RepID=A0ABS7D4D4_9BACL|nr:cobyrinate a,c-diamide synthase [Paenibacillus oenotherae]MBW7474351.1 cobyrinate a,c-diamide synthase [Paenibacillus oenotherae]
MHNRIVIAGTGSSVGKTTLTLGIMAALRHRGLTVQGFKCGPDYIDPTYHTAVTGRTSRNLDSWMLETEDLKAVFLRGSEGADISIIEGVMGLFDGKNPLSNEGTTAEISCIIGAPVILVVNCQSMARSAAAIVKGFQCFSDDVQIKGVIANKVGSSNHYKLVKSAIEQECGIPVLGYLPRESGIAIPERHLGLIPSVERGELDELFSKLAQLIGETIDLDRLLEVAASRSTVQSDSRLFRPSPELAAAGNVRIAVARDAAFHFYYPENLELLEASGAELAFFSPLAGEAVPPDVSGLYLGGGFPEEFAETLAGNEGVKASVREAVQSGMPTLAECGGYMYLTEAIVSTDGHRHAMVGLIPGEVTMQKKLAALGYREVTAAAGHYLIEAGETAKGHEFHYSTYNALGHAGEPAYTVKGMRGTQPDGYRTANLSAGYTHLHFASAPFIPQRFVKACRQYQGHDTEIRT